ncbi:hypothetical protein CC86DRAFT_92734 [Ophiobolus disseminans]|uniref:Uncharacterized protein n=1 Tax=Ophiobolus disseminans TaxID=1469910 RepID=A0A6A7AIZ5_9PLEO|nr:hypothetical protein CC86DRAFT_92734 [Ophiobolus disseminans]
MPFFGMPKAVVYNAPLAIAGYQTEAMRKRREDENYTLRTLCEPIEAHLDSKKGTRSTVGTFPDDQIHIFTATIAHIIVDVAGHIVYRKEEEGTTKDDALQCLNRTIEDNAAGK